MNPVINRLRKSRKAALLHLGLSAFVALVSIALVFQVWYPGELSAAQGVSRIVLLMIGVDVVVGPLITAVVFDANKKGIHFDITVIAAMQTAALLYGMNAIHGGRPVYVVFNVNRFDVVALQDVSLESLAKVPSGLEPSRWRPRFVAAKLPDDPTKRSDLLFSSLEGGPDLPQLPEYYVPLQNERTAMLAKLHPLNELKKTNGMSEADWRRLLEGLGQEENKVGYLPLSANEKDGAVILDRSSAEIIGIRMLTPRFGSPEPPGQERPMTPSASSSAS